MSHGTHADIHKRTCACAHIHTHTHTYKQGSREATMFYIGVEVTGISGGLSPSLMCPLTIECVLLL